MIHEKIYLQIKDEYGNDQEEVSWCKDQVFPSDLEYQLILSEEEIGRREHNEWECEKQSW